MPSGIHPEGASTLGRTQTPDFSARRDPRRRGVGHVGPPRALCRRNVRHQPGRRGRRDRGIPGGSGQRFCHARRDPHHFSIRVARRIAGAASGGQRRNRENSTRRQRAGRSLCESNRRRLRRVQRGASRPGRGRRPWPDGAAPTGAGLDAANQQSRTRCRTGLRHGRGGFQEPRRRSWRARRAAGARVSRGIVQGSGASSTSAASRTSRTCRREALSAASTQARETY
jgi:hypothetical protein